MEDLQSPQSNAGFKLHKGSVVRAVWARPIRSSYCKCAPYAVWTTQLFPGFRD